MYNAASFGRFGYSTDDWSERPTYIISAIYELSKSFDGLCPFLTVELQYILDSRKKKVRLESSSVIVELQDN